MLQVRRWRLKGCPRCRGDVFFDRDMDGWYGQCLQCGYETAFPIIPRVYHPVSNEEQNQYVKSIEQLSRV